MKLKFTYLLFLLALGAVVFSGSSGGAGLLFGEDRTGSPLSAGSCGATGCHSGGAFNPTLTAVLLKDNQPVERYEPGEDYRFRITITAATGNPSGYGFQAVALTGNDNRNAGAFSDLPDGVRTTLVNNRSYVEHGRRLSSNVIEVKWTAPAQETEDIRFYATGNAVNGNSSSSGDGVVTLSTPLVVKRLLSSRQALQALPVQLNLWPNPATGPSANLRISGAEPGQYQLQLIDLTGRILSNRTLRLGAGRNEEPVDLQSLSPGHYTLRLSDGKRQASMPLIRQ